VTTSTTSSSIGGGMRSSCFRQALETARDGVAADALIDEVRQRHGDLLVLAMTIS